MFNYVFNTVSWPGLQNFINKQFINITRLAALIALSLIIGIIGSLIYGAWPAIRSFGWSFLISTSWNPVTGQFGALTSIYGTLISSLIAIIIAVPISFYIALFITELAPKWLKLPLSSAIELLAAIPSIIYGMWGLFVLAPVLGDYVQPWINKYTSQIPFVGQIFSGPNLGIGLFTAGLILAIMIIPFITAVIKDAFEATPKSQKESAYALGASTWEVTTHITFAYSKTAIIGGIFLGLGRALGETMAVTFVIGNANRISHSLFMPANTISSAIANQFNEASDPMYTASLIALGLILFCISFFVLAIAKLILHRTKDNK